jgi:hypothetical protein
MLHYKGGLSVANILVPSTQNTGIIRAKGHMHEKDTQEKYSKDHKCQDAEEKCYRACI